MPRRGSPNDWDSVIDWAGQFRCAALMIRSAAFVVSGQAHEF